MLQGRVDGRHRDPCARLEKRLGEALQQTPRIEHELERQLRPRYRPAARRPDSAVQHIAARVTLLRASLDDAPRGIGELAVGPGADAEIVPEAPVVEIVPALVAAPGMSGDLVALQPGVLEARHALAVHLPDDVLVGALGREPVKKRVRLDGELVVGNMAHAMIKRLLEVGERAAERLPGQAVHEVDVDALEAGGTRHFHRPVRAAGIVDTADTLQCRVVEALNPDGQAIDTGVAIAGETLRLGTARIGFQRDLTTLRELGARADPLEECADGGDREKARCSAAYEHAVEGPPRGARELLVQIGEQRGDVFGLWNVLGGVGVEVAVWALTFAPGKVHVERERRNRCETHHDASRCASRARIAVARWLMLFLSAGASSAEVQPRSSTKNTGS